MEAISLPLEKIVHHKQSRVDTDSDNVWIRVYDRKHNSRLDHSVENDMIWTKMISGIIFTDHFNAIWYTKLRLTNLNANFRIQTRTRFASSCPRTQLTGSMKRYFNSYSRIVILRAVIEFAANKWENNS